MDKRFNMVSIKKTTNGLISLIKQVDVTYLQANPVNPRDLYSKGNL